MMPEEDVIKLLAQAMDLLTEKNQEIVNLLREMNKKLDSLDNYLRSATSSSKENQNLYELEIKENPFHPLLALNLPEAPKETLYVLTELYLEKKRPINIKEIEERLSYGYEAIYAHLRQLQEMNPPWVDEPVTKRSLKQELNLIKIQGNPENIDLNLPEAHGRALFWKPTKGFLDFMESRKTIEDREE